MENKFNIGIEPFSGMNNASPFGGVGAQPTIGFGPGPRPGIAQPAPERREEEPEKEEEPGKKKKKKNIYEITC